MLPAYLPMRRWFAGKGEKLHGVEIINAAMLPDTARPILLMELRARTGRSTDDYLLPVGFLPEQDLVSALPQQLALARVRRGAKLGYLTDAFSLDALARGILDLLRARRTVPTTDGEIRFVPTSRLETLQVPAETEIRRLAAEQSNSSLVIGNLAVLKLIRRVAPGLHPEAEMGRYLTERGFANIAPMYGEVTRVAKDGTPHVLAVLQAYIDNQGDAWSWTQNMLSRAIQDAIMVIEGAGGEKRDDALAEFGRFATTLGQRIGEMHAVLAQPGDDAAFAPEAATPKDCAHWAEEIRARVDEALDLLAARREWASETDRELAAGVVALRKRLHDVIAKGAELGAGSLRTRIHGDLHLGQVLVAQADVFIIDFEGEPARPLAERRAKSSPLRDVAGMLRSFDYATAMAAGSGGAGQGRTEEARKRDILERFRKISEQSFLAAYREASVGVAHQWASAGAEGELLDLFVLQKAAYEIAYEAANRPAWLGVPLRGFAAIATQLTKNGRG